MTGSVNGPLLRTWTDAAATAPAEGVAGVWNGTEPTDSTPTDQWIGAPPGTPDWGYWDYDAGSGWTYFITEPGYYTAEVYCLLTFDGALDSNAMMKTTVVPGMHTYNTMRQTSFYDPSSNTFLLATHYLPPLVAHPDMDNTYWAGYAPPIKNFVTPGSAIVWETPGSARVPTAVTWEFSLFQWQPGAATPSWR